MLQTFEAMIDEVGNVQLLETVKLPAKRRVLVTVLSEEIVRHDPTSLRQPDEAQARLSESWQEFFRIGDEIAELAKPGEESLTTTLLKMRR